MTADAEMILEQDGYVYPVERLIGEADGPWEFHPEFGHSVPTYLDERKDLLPPKHGASVRLNYHVPFAMREHYKPQWLPPKFYAQYGQQYPVDLNGFVVCSAQAAMTGARCRKKAVNRSPYCRSHGGALHPADKRLSANNFMIDKVSVEKKDSLSRVQKFVSGMLPIDELDDDEVLGGFVRDTDGKIVESVRIGAKFHQELVKELVRRMNRFMTMKLPNMLKVMTDIAESDFVEPADRIKAAQWVAERVIGKTPDVIVHAATDKPYESILARLEGGSRDEYRNAIEAAPPGGVRDSGFIEGEVVEIEGQVFREDRDDFDDDGEEGDFGVESGSETESNGESNGKVESGIESGRIECGEPPKVNGSATAAATVDARIADAKARAARLKAAKARRFAMRAQGFATDMANRPWEIEYDEINDGSGRFVASITPSVVQSGVGI